MPVEVNPNTIVLGAEQSGLGEGAPISLPVAEFAKHMAVVAATGSGKTVLVRRVVEEASLRRISSIIIDVANDLVRFGDRWPAETSQAPDSAIAELYFKQTETIVWTPGWEGGNPLSLSPVPDFEPVR